MFEKTIKKVIKELNDSKQGEVDRLKTEIQELKLQKRLEEEEIKHLVKMKEEKNEIEVQKKLIEIERKFADKETELMKGYHLDLINRFKKEQENLQTVYTEIMKRLPTINVDVKR